METDPITEEDYIRRVLEAYRKTPGTTGTVRRPDRLLTLLGLFLLHERPDARIGDLQRQRHGLDREPVAAEERPQPQRGGGGQPRPRP